MPTDAISLMSPKQEPRLIFPFKSLALISLGLIIVAFLVVLQIRQQAQERLYSDLKSRADVLIWAVEGSERSMMMQRSSASPVSQSLVEEIAKQPTIAFVAVLDVNGIALAHSMPEQRGTRLSIFSEFTNESMAEASQGRLFESAQGKIYEVIKSGSLAKSERLDRNHTRKMPMHNAVNEEFYIVVAIDAEQFTTEMEKHNFHYVLIAFLLVMGIIGSITLLFYAQSLTASKRLLLDTQVLASQLFAKLPIGVFTTDKAGIITLCNESAIALLGLKMSGEQALSVHVHPWFDWKHIALFLERNEQVLEHEVEFTADDGKATAVSIAASPLAQSDGSISDYLFIVRDMIEVKKLQKQLRLNERLTALGDLAAGVAHELRNPLSSVKGYATFLSMKLQDNEPLKEKAKMMLIEVERLGRVVSDLLSMANPGKPLFRLEPLLPLVKRVVSLTEAEANQKGVNLIFTSQQSEENECFAMLDGDKIIQTLLNLTINAVQATEKNGTVHVSLLQVAGKGLDTSDAGSVVISIADTGSGISSEVQAHIFTPYFTTKPSGTGLGLAIAHGIIEQHGGAITVSSKPGQGSVFSVTLPLHKAMPKEHA